jgi:hypothetical protein
MNFQSRFMLTTSQPRLAAAHPLVCMYEGRWNTRFVEKGWVGLSSQSERSLCSLSEICSNSILNNLEYLNVLVQSILGWLENLAIRSESGKISG